MGRPCLQESSALRYTAMAKGQLQNGVPLLQLPLQQLEYLKGQVEEELRMLTDPLSKLKVAQQKFCDSIENGEKLEKNEMGTSILVPMSSSMYVPGSLANVAKVTVEIGAGYFAEKSI